MNDLNDNKTSFWPSYVDIMTTLFAIMLVLFVVSYSRFKIKEAELKKMADKYTEIKSIYKAVENIDSTYFEFNEEWLISHEGESPADEELMKSSASKIVSDIETFEEHFEQTAGENGKLLAANVAETRKFEVKTPDVVIKVNPERTDLVETMMIEGRQCLVIQIDEHLEVNGITVNPNTGEVIMNDTY